MKPTFAAIIITLSICFSLMGQAQSDESGIYIKVGQAQIKKSLLALTPLKVEGTAVSASAARSLGLNLYKTIYNDLDVSGYFQFLRQEAFIENTAEASVLPKSQDPGGFQFQNWSAINAEFLIKSTFRLDGDNLTLSAYLYHVPQQKLIFGNKYQAPQSSYRKLAHTFTAEVLEKVTGKKGMFLSKLVYARSTSSAQVKEIFLSDWDMQNTKQLTSHQHLSLSPSFSFDGTKVAYTSYTRRRSGKRDPDLYVLDLTNGKRTLVSQRTGAESGSMWLPDGNSLLITHSQGGSPDIFKINLNGRILQRLTAGPRGAMNIEPAIPRDGSKIAFASDRGGRLNLYTMNPDGSGTQLLTFAGKYNSTPSWSPDGQKIVFGSYIKDHYDIFIMDSNGRNLKKLTEAKLANGRPASNEDPSFSPDGRHIVFVSTRTGKRQLYLINPDGTNERRLTEDSYDYFKPKWSHNY